MGLFRWFCRCVPALSLVLWIFIAWQALTGRIPSFFGRNSDKQKLYDWHHLSAWEYIYIFYSVAAHIHGCILFPARLCWSIWHMTEEVRLAKYEAAEVTRPYAESEDAKSVDDKASLLSLAPSNASSSSDGPLSRVSTPKMGTFEEIAESVIHAIILPSYKEDLDTLRETLSVLASHILAKSSYDVYLALEQRDPDAQTTGNTLTEAYQDCFRQISFTLHPGDIAGEVAGKSSNVGWAARQMSHNYVDYESRRNCVVTVMDSDTHLSSNYFLLLTKSHREDPEAASTMYSVPIIFDRNAQEVNPLVRAADIFWCGAGLSGLYKSSAIKIPTSVYSMAMSLAGDVGGWDTGPESIGEDMHMYLKCYFKTKGHFHVKIIYSPASQSNVTSDIKGPRGFFANIHARYKQALRHMWGSLDSGYAVQKSLESLFRKKDERLSGWLSTPSPEERVPKWVNDSNLKHFTPPNLYEQSTEPTRSRFSLFKLAILYTRLYEAHFLPAHLTAALVSGLIFSAYIPASTTHPLLVWALSFCGTLRFIGFCGTGLFIYLYESYHSVCVRNREDEMKRVGLWEDMQGGFAHRSWRKNWSDYVAIPVNGTLFGTVPAVVAEVCHLWTDQLVYTVSAKPQLKRLAERVIQLA